MKHLAINISLMMGVLLFMYTIGCRAQRVTPDAYTGKQLSFGNGGGFTGAVTEYILLDNGQIFSTNKETKENKLLKQLSGSITRQLFQKAEKFQLDQIEFSHPGNIYYFISYKENHTTHRITWGNPGYTVPEEAENLYQLLIASVPQE